MGMFYWSPNQLQKKTQHWDHANYSKDPIVNLKPKTFFLRIIEQEISLENYLQFMKQKFKQMNNIIVS
jgi:hypothetical protein